ncbi:DUF1129 family protein [Ureibacillus composti]|nr:DUF1129 family protein [Ureibacillus composti]
MSLTVKDIVRQNNEKRKLLTLENEIYYENMLVYIRTNAFRDEKATEEVLLEMLDHLLDAQAEGKTAEEVFGKSPKELAEEIITSLPKESFKSLAEFTIETVLNLFGWFLVVWGIWPLINKKEQTIHLGSLSLSALLLVASLVVLLYLIFAVIRNHAFSDQRKKKIMTWGLGFFVWILFVAGFALNFLIDPIGPSVEISFYTAFGLGCFFILATYVLKKSRESR